MRCLLSSNILVCRLMNNLVIVIPAKDRCKPSDLVITDSEYDILLVHGSARPR